MIRTPKSDDPKWILHVDATALAKFPSKEATYLWLARQPDPIVVQFEASFDSGLGFSVGGLLHPDEIPKADLCICPEGFFNTL